MFAIRNDKTSDVSQDTCLSRVHLWKQSNSLSQSACNEISSSQCSTLFDHEQRTSVRPRSPRFNKGIPSSARRRPVLTNLFFDFTIIRLILQGLRQCFRWNIMLARFKMPECIAVSSISLCTIHQHSLCTLPTHSAPYPNS
jgi:hypothetical protein